MSKYVPRNIRYYKGGRPDVFPIKIKDFNEMTRICLVNRDKADAINDKKNKHRWWRNYLILITGANTGHRIERLLQIFPQNIEGGSVSIQEFKTGKKKKYEISKKLLGELEEFIEYYDISDHEFIFKTFVDKPQPLTRQQAWNIIKELSEEVGIKYNIGPHSLRKTFGRALYDDTKDIFLVQNALEHDNPHDTERYICLESNVVEKYRKKANYGIHDK
ncbi:MAG: tyrosine-type recombinase/integrase [Erysipelotrichaceae bacterium]